MKEPIGIIAGHGRLPIHTAVGIRAAGRQVACVGLRELYDPSMPVLCDHFGSAAVTRLGRWIRLFKRWGVREVVMVGTVRKQRMYDPFRLLRNFPDWRAAKIWYYTVKGDRRTDRLLGALADELQREGITLIDTTRYIPDQLAQVGVMTRCKPSVEQYRDIEFALPIVRRMGDLDIGQSIAVKEREVIAVEAMEGTDAMIQRAGQLCRSGKWMLVKVAKPRQDMRFDVPTVGLKTIENLKAAGATCLAVQAGQVILLDKQEFLEAADRAGIAVIGIQIDPTLCC